MKSVSCDFLLGSFTFCASSHDKEECGVNGLPLTLNSTCIIGQFQKLRLLSHQNLCVYIDAICSKHERIFIVFEHYQMNLDKKILDGILKESEILKISFEILNAISYLHSQNICNINLSPKNILFDSQNKVKLSFYGLNYMTNYGQYVQFPIGCPKYISPEILISKFNNSVPTYQGWTYKSDVWAFGFILLEMTLEKIIWTTISIDEIFKKIVFTKNDKHPVDFIIDDNNVKENFQNITANYKEIIYMSLNLKPSKRPTVNNILTNSIFSKFNSNEKYIEKSNSIDIFEYKYSNLKENLINNVKKLSVEEAYFFWKLGFDILLFYLKHDKIAIYPSILNFTRFISNQGKIICDNVSLLFDDSVVVLDMDQLLQKLNDVNVLSFFSLIEYRKKYKKEVKQLELPLIIKEKDLIYQIQRNVLFERLIKGYPFTRPLIVQDCHLDIPPFYRSYLWAILLDLQGDVKSKYDSIDKLSEGPSDRQIEVDIPRCHQYNSLLSSPVGHLKLKRILKAWSKDNSEYVYWQGLDSLAAPFIYINFNDEAVAYGCLCSFIKKYLHNFFLKDNSSIIKEYLNVFSNIIAFHDPVLYNHMNSIGFIAELYAISWFLTMYAHVFPINKIFYLWDTLLLGDASFPFCIGVAILRQLRAKILSLDFNDCILLFSEMPDIDIERCVYDAKKIFNSTPRRCLLKPYISSLNDQNYIFDQDFLVLKQNSKAKQSVCLTDLKNDKCLRISAIDLTNIIESITNQSSSQSSKAMLLIIDVRPENEYLKGSMRESINAPAHLLTSSSDNLTQKKVFGFLNNNSKAIKVIIGSNHKESFEIADMLIKLGFGKICVLDDGIDVLKNQSLLIVSPSQLF